jgi:hypothetical protein
MLCGGVAHLSPASVEYGFGRVPRFTGVVSRGRLAPFADSQEGVLALEPNQSGNEVHG